ncbi:hypothetical protein N7520_007440 [Penicillium odoratum]|uniref:uncharacterized protein n=1 Tax=Penicillium odoratum TaxID=1167516 RepID=UPI0025489E1A|nr:uncharacterized protein N7520_007440 [Penicillium odoratum]KAJ5760284.1 hypothetical protein N7520_007440 [Penicillium odoratum]
MKLFDVFLPPTIVVLAMADSVADVGIGFRGYIERNTSFEMEKESGRRGMIYFPRTCTVKRDD